MSCVRGDVVELRAPRGVRGHEQAGVRYAVVLQSDDLTLSTLLIAPTSRSARPTSFRPTITVAGQRTQVLVEQTAAVDPARLGRTVAAVTRYELDAIRAALRLVLELD